GGRKKRKNPPPKSGWSITTVFANRLSSSNCPRSAAHTPASNSPGSTAAPPRARPACIRSQSPAAGRAAHTPTAPTTGARRADSGGRAGPRPAGAGRLGQRLLPLLLGPRPVRRQSLGVLRVLRVEPGGVGGQLRGVVEPALLVADGGQVVIRLGVVAGQADGV